MADGQGWARSLFFIRTRVTVRCSVTAQPDLLQEPALLTSASTASAFSISAASMCQELKCTTIQAQAGIGLYAWGAAVMPLFIAPISEEFGRRPVYLTAAVTFILWHVMNGA